MVKRSAAHMESDVAISEPQLSVCGRYVVRLIDGQAVVLTVEDHAQANAPPGTILIPLSRGYVAIIDTEDAHLAKHSWHAHVSATGVVYAKRSAFKEDGRRTCLYLHRAVMDVSKSDEIVDHKDGDGLNCRRQNLRVVSHTENKRNISVRKASKTGHAGVSISGMRYRARLGRKDLGTFATLNQAVAARLAAEKSAYGIQPRRAVAHAEAQEIHP